MTTADYLDAVEARFRGDLRFISAVTLSLRPGVFVGKARTLAGTVLYETAEHATGEAAARELAQIAGTGLW